MMASVMSRDVAVRAPRLGVVHLQVGARGEGARELRDREIEAHAGRQAVGGRDAQDRGTGRELRRHSEDVLVDRDLGLRVASLTGGGPRGRFGRAQIRIAAS
jgi:hypothetical protein